MTSRVVLGAPPAPPVVEPLFLIPLKCTNNFTHELGIAWAWDECVQLLPTSILIHVYFRFIYAGNTV